MKTTATTKIPADQLVASALRRESNMRAFSRVTGVDLQKVRAFGRIREAAKNQPKST